MSNDCKHFVEPFSVQEPTASQIAQYKLDQCEICHKWFSFLGVCKEWHKRGIIQHIKDGLLWNRPGKQIKEK